MTVRIEVGPSNGRAVLGEAFFQQQLPSLSAQTQERCVVIDLKHCLQISSRQLNSLIALNSQLRSESRELVLANLSEPIREVFELTRLDRLFHIEASNLVPEHSNLVPEHSNLVPEH